MIPITFPLFFLHFSAAWFRAGLYRPPPFLRPPPSRFLSSHLPSPCHTIPPPLHFLPVVVRLRLLLVDIPFRLSVLPPPHLLTEGPRSMKQTDVGGSIANYFKTARCLHISSTVHSASLAPETKRRGTKKGYVCSSEGTKRGPTFIFENQSHPAAALLFQNQSQLYAAGQGGEATSSTWQQRRLTLTYLTATGENPDAKISRFKGLQGEEELEFLFDKVVAKGEYAYASGSDSLPSRRSVTSSQFSKNHFEDIIDVDTEVVDTPMSNYGRTRLWRPREMIVSPPFDEFPNASQYNRRIQEIFKGVIGAIDGTLIHASIKTREQIPYRARGRNECYQNVMAICDFNMVFTNVVTGWEGPTDDSRVLQETMRNTSNHFPLPPNDRYYLVDAAYTNTRVFLAPYQNVRYWLPDFRSGG